MIPNIASPQGASVSTERICILVVEDEFLIRIMLSECLRDAGYHVIEAINADEALVIIGTTHLDMIISDVRMPGSMDGMGLLATVRETHPALPVIITSAHFEAKLAIAKGAAQFLAKPYTCDLVIETVQKELEKPHD